MFSQTELERLRELAKKYDVAKAVMLFAEELDPTGTYNLQVQNEIRHAFDHLMRVLIKRFEEVDAEIEPDSNYAIKNLDSVLGHVYRSQWDALDGAALSLKETAFLTVGAYPSAVLAYVMPEYWDFRATIDEIVDKIPEYRKQKDIGNNESVAVKDYLEQVRRLSEINKTFSKKGKLLDEELNKQKAEEEEKKKLSWNQGLILALLSAGAGVALTLLIQSLLLQ